MKSPVFSFIPEVPSTKEKVNSSWSNSPKIGLLNCTVNITLGGTCMHLVLRDNSNYHFTKHEALYLL